jgi:O-antigen/teichoic acid export membrane protein
LGLPERKEPRQARPVARPKLTEVDAPIYTGGRARRSLIDTVTFRVLSQVTTALALIIQVRGMPEHDFGVYSLLYTFIPVIGTLLSLGLEQVMQRYLPEYLRAGNQRGAAWLMRRIATGRLATNILLIAVVLLCWNLVAPLFKLTPYRGTFAVFSFLILLQFQSRILQLALASHMMHRYSVGSMTMLSVVKLLTYGSLYLTHRLTLETAIFADMFAYGCAYVMLRTIYNKQCLIPEARGRYQSTPEERKRLFRYGLYNNFNDAGVFLLYSTVDNFFIAAYLDTVSVGIYSFYGRLRQTVVNALPAKQFENIIQPMFFAIPAAQADRNVPRYFCFLLNMNFLLQWPALAFATAYHHEIVQLVFHGKFIDKSWLLAVFMGFATLNVFADPVSLVAQYEEKAHVLLLSKLFAAYNILAMFLLVPFLGVYGAAIAAGTAQALKNFFIWWCVRRRAVWTNARAAILSSVGIWGTVVGICYGLKAVLPLPAIFQVVLGGIIFIAAGLIYIRSPALSASDREILRTVTPSKAARLMQRVGFLPA